MKKQAHYKIICITSLQAVIVHLLFAFFSAGLAVKLVWLGTYDTFL